MVAIPEVIREWLPGGRAAKLESQREQLREQVRENFRHKYKELTARFDAAQDTVDNKRHWSNADTMSADAASNPAVRNKLRSRSRYECQENNCYGKGIIIKHANHIVGRVPRLQMQTSDDAFNDFVEQHFEKWAKAICLGSKLRTMAKAKTVDGEAFAQLVTNEKISHIVKLDLLLIEADQVATPMLTGREPNYIDGIKLDEQGLNPIHYDVLQEHPGALHMFKKFTLEPKHVPANEMLHWYRQDRPRQFRPQPETTPALPLFGQLRRFTLATIAAAETAAEMAGVIKSTASDVSAEVDPMEVIEIEMRQLMTLPHGWDISQLKAEHPTTTYEMFERAILTQIAQPVLMPYNVAAGDSSRHNFASGRLDHKMYEQSIDIERYDLDCQALMKLFASWYREFRLAAAETGLWRGDMLRFDELMFTWFFDAADHAVDPSKDASGEEKRLGFGGTTLPELYSRRGLDYRREMKRGAESLGVSVETYQALIRQRVFGSPEPEEPETDEANGEEAAGDTETIDDTELEEIEATMVAAQ